MVVGGNGAENPTVLTETCCGVVDGATLSTGAALVTVGSRLGEENPATALDATGEVPVTQHRVRVKSQNILLEI